MAQELVRPLEGRDDEVRHRQLEGDQKLEPVSEQEVGPDRQASADARRSAVVERATRAPPGRRQATQGQQQEVWRRHQAERQAHRRPGRAAVEGGAEGDVAEDQGQVRPQLEAGQEAAKASLDTQQPLAAAGGDLLVQEQPQHSRAARALAEAAGRTREETG